MTGWCRLFVKDKYWNPAVKYLFLTQASLIELLQKVSFMGNRYQHIRIFLHNKGVYSILYVFVSIYIKRHVAAAETFVHSTHTLNGIFLYGSHFLFLHMQYRKTGLIKFCQIYNK